MGSVTIGTDTFDIFGTAAGLATRANGSAAYYATYAAAVLADATNVSRTHVEATRLIGTLTFDDDIDDDPATAAADSQIALACYELVLAALVDADVLTRADTGSRVKRVGGSGVPEVEFFGPAPALRFPSRVMAILGPLLASASGASSTVTAGGYVSGTDTCSDFDDADRYGVT